MTLRVKGHRRQWLRLLAAQLDQLFVGFKLFWCLCVSTDDRMYWPNNKAEQLILLALLCVIYILPHDKCEILESAHLITSYGHVHHNLQYPTSYIWQYCWQKIPYQYFHHFPATGLKLFRWKKKEETTMHQKSSNVGLEYFDFQTSRKHIFTFLLWDTECRVMTKN